MIPYELDPSLHHAEPTPVLLDDGFSPPVVPPRETQAEDAPPVERMPAQHPQQSG